MVDLVKGGLAWTRDHPSQVHVAEEESQVFREVKDNHVDGGARNGLFGFEHVKWVETIHVETKPKVYFISPITEKASPINVLSGPLYPVLST